MRPVPCRCVVLILALGVSFPAAAQSLVEVAKKERARRERLRAADPARQPRPASAAARSSGPKELGEALVPPPLEGGLPNSPNEEGTEPVQSKASAVVPIAPDPDPGLERQDPGDIQARRDLARTYAASGNFSAARAEYRKLLELDPADVDSIVGIAQTYQWSGAEAQAREWYEKAMALDPSSNAAEIGLGYVELWNEPALAAERAQRLWYRSPGNQDVNRLLRESLDARAPSVLFSYDALSDTHGNAMDTSWVEGSVGLSIGDLRFGGIRYEMSYDGLPRAGTIGSGKITSIYGALRTIPRSGQRLDLRFGVDQRDTTFDAVDLVAIGGAAWKIGVGRRWSAGLAVDRNSFRYTTQGLDEGIVLNVISGSIGTSLTDKWSWDGGADYWVIDDYLNRDNRRFGAQTGIRYRSALSPRFPMEAGYLFRYFTFDQNFGVSFFSPASYRAHQVHVRLSGDLGSFADFLVQVDTGLQSYDLVRREPLVAGTAMIGFEIGRGYRFEIFGIRGDYLLLSDFGVRSNQIGARFRWKAAASH